MMLSMAMLFRTPQLLPPPQPPPLPVLFHKVVNNHWTVWISAALTTSPLQDTLLKLSKEASLILTACAYSKLAVQCMGL